MSVTFEGGSQLAKLKKQAASMSKVRGYDVGFFAGAKYQDGAEVALVAAWNEFGTDSIPERPFFRQANKAVEHDLTSLLSRALKSGKPIDARVVDVMGNVHKGAVQRSITNLRTPANDPATVQRKKSSNPLIDTGFMRASTTWKVLK